MEQTQRVVRKRACPHSGFVQDRGWWQRLVRRRSARVPGVSCWRFHTGPIIRTLTAAGCYFSFAGGFTLGNLLGVVIEKRLGIGTVVVRIITHREAGVLIDRLKDAGYGLTSMDAQGATGPVK